MPRKVNIVKNLDWFTVFLFLILIIFGWLNIYASSYQFEHQSLLDFSQKYGKQILWIIATVIIAVIIFLFDNKFFSTFAYVIYGIILFLLIITLLFGTASHGAKSWLQIGGFSIQTAEFAKFATALAVAKYMSHPSFNIENFRQLIIAITIIFIPMGLILLQNDAGTALIFTSFIFVFYRKGLSGNFLLLGIFIIGLFIVTLLFPLKYIFYGILGMAFLIFWLMHKNLKHVFFTLVIFGIVTGIFFLFNNLNILAMDTFIIIGISTLMTGLIGLMWAYINKFIYVNRIILTVFFALIFTTSVDYLFNNILEQHQRSRINVLLGKKEDIKGAGYNIYQSKIAIGSGGLSGKGFLKGTQTKLDFVPEQSTDFIFCTVGEEWGFIGSSATILVFMILLMRLVIIAERQRNEFSKIYGYGVASILFFHFAINVGMTIGLTPVIGIPLPFFSYGGSSLLGFSILLLIFLRLDASRSIYL